MHRMYIDIPLCKADEVIAEHETANDYEILLATNDKKLGGHPRRPK